MTFEFALKRPLLSPHFIQYGNEKPRPADRAHVLGKGVEDLSGGQNQNQGGRNEEDSRRGGKYDARGYRKLTSIKLGEVKNAYDFYENHLMPSFYGSFMATNHFYMIDLAQREKDIPAAIFGRVNVCHPGDGQIQNIREMELSFPQSGGKPDTVNLHPRDILPHGNIQSYCVRVKFLASPEDIADFNRYENLFLEEGFALDFSPGFIDLLDMNETNKESLPWFHVIGSRWFASVPQSMQEEVRSRVKRLVEWDSLILNYHPDNLPVHVRTLNRELDFQYGFTDFVLIEPRDPGQVVKLIKSTFEKIFAQPIKSPPL